MKDEKLYAGKLPILALRGLAVFPDQTVILHHAVKAEIPMTALEIFIVVNRYIVAACIKQVKVDLTQVIRGLRNAPFQQPIQLPIFIKQTGCADRLKRAARRFIVHLHASFNKIFAAQRLLPRKPQRCCISRSAGTGTRLPQTIRCTDFQDLLR